MKKFGFLLISLVVLFLAACGSSDDDKESSDVDKNNEENSVINIGATSTPHAEILEKAKPILEKKNIDLKVKEYQDYVLPNDDVASGDLDANFHQHIPYMEQTNEDAGYDLVNVGEIHIEPMGIYSKNIENVDDIKKGTEVIMSRSVADHGRILMLFEDNDLIKLKKGTNKTEAEVKDITENKLDLKFEADVEAGFQPEIYEKEKDALVAINTNYAIKAGLQPKKDAVIIEDDNSPYVNIIATTEENKDNKDLKELAKALHSKEIQEFIDDEYEGAVVPVDGK